MKIITSSLQPIQFKSEIPVPQYMRDHLTGVNSQDWTNFFRHIQLNLQDRILGLSGDDLIKLQGKLELIGEFDNLFKKLFEKSS